MIGLMNLPLKNLLVVLGPTASGKTRTAVRLAHALSGEIISADSRQVYRGLDIGAGKDLHEYVFEGRPIPYHLIDVVDLNHEFSVFDYQRRFFQIFIDLDARGIMPVLAGGTGLYLDAVLSGYRMVEVPENPRLRAALRTCSLDELAARLRTLKPRLHNTTDLTERERLVRAIEIGEYEREHAPEPLPPVRALVLGIRWPADELRRRIRARLDERMRAGMIEEVQRLHDSGVSWERLNTLGLEYRYVSDFLRGTIQSRAELEQTLFTAIGRFAKRQRTWFRRMERLGTHIHWVDGADPGPALEVLSTVRFAGFPEAGAGPGTPGE